MTPVMQPLRDLVSPCRSWNPAEGAGSFTYIDLSSVDKDLKAITRVEEHACSAAPSRARQLVASGDVLVATVRPNLNGVALIEPSHDGMTASTGYCVLRPKASVLYSRYLFHWVRTPQFVAAMVKAATGATYPAVSDAKVKDSLIPLLPLPEQKHIALVLDAAQELQLKRRASINQLDSLIQAAFLEMFGDPVTNPKGWEVRPLQDLGPLNRGVSTHRPRNEPGLLGGPHPLIQTGDVANSDGYIRRYSSTYSDLGLKQSRKWPAGTLCITIAANIASTGILTFESCFPDSVVGFLAGELSRVEYVRWAFQAFKSTLDSKATQVAQKNINLQTLRTLPVPCPPLDLQTRFAFIVNSIEQQKARLKAHLADLDALFASLQSRAFSGELCSPSFAQQHASA